MIGRATANFVCWFSSTYWCLRIFISHWSKWASSPSFFFRL